MSCPTEGEVEREERDDCRCVCVGIGSGRLTHSALYQSCGTEDHVSSTQLEEEEEEEEGGGGRRGECLQE